MLRDELGFVGLAVSDALDMGALTGGATGGVDVGGALRAGTDLLLCGPDPAAQARVEAGLAAAFASGGLDPAETAASSARLSVQRDWLAGFDQPPISVVGCAEHAALAAELAARSITLIRDRERRIPLDVAPSGRILVIEPRARDLTPADTTSSLTSGGLAAAVRTRHPAADGVVVEALVSVSEIAGLRDRAAAADLVVLGTVDALGDPTAADLARALVASGTPLVAVALRGPWDAAAYPEVGTVLATYGIRAPSLAALADALFGQAPISGRLPVRLERP
jgi:beta-N-acetylhexosaminidase